VTTATTPTGQTGALVINTVPRGVTIYLNNQVKGTSPATIQGLSPGDYELKLMKQGYKTQVRTVTIEAGKTYTPPLIILTPIM